MRIVIPDDYQDCLHTLACYAALAGHEVVRYREPARDMAHFADMLRGADAVVAVRERSDFPRALLEQLPTLKLISQVGRSAQTIDLEACNALGITVCAGTQASPIAPAELTWALILAARRNVVLEATRMRQGEWPATLSHRLAGSTLGIYGLGTIGQLVARVGPAFGMRVLVWGRDGSRDAALRLGYGFADSREQFFSESDVISLHVRLSAQTSGMVTASDLARMKPSALFGQHLTRRVDRARRPGGGLGRGPARLRRGGCLRARAGLRRRSSAAGDAQRRVHAASGLG